MKVDVAVLGSPPLMVSVDVKQHCSLCIPVEAIVMYVEMCVICVDVIIMYVEMFVMYVEVVM